MEHEGNGDTNYNQYTRNNYQKLGKGTGRLRSQSTSWSHPDYSIIILFVICRCLPPGWTWHKVKSPNADKGEGKAGNEPRLEPCWSVLLIDPLSAMWVEWAKQFHESISGSGHVCRVSLELDNKV